MKITKYTIIKDITKMTDRAEEILAVKGMQCLGCPMSETENLEHAALIHGLDLDGLVDYLNKEINK